MGNGSPESPLQATEPADAPSRHLWRHLRWLVLGVAAVVVVVVVTVVVGSDPPTPPVRGTPLSGSAPLFELEDLRDPEETVALADYRGRPVVVNFFAAWCNPCRREMPALQSVYERVQDDVTFIGVDNQDIRSDGLGLLEETGVTYPAGFDPEGRVARDYGLLGMPTTVFIAADGEQLELATGEMTEERLLATIDRLFEPAAN